MLIYSLTKGFHVVKTLKKVTKNKVKKSLLNSEVFVKVCLVILFILP